jgi:hypothetical protein
MPGINSMASVKHPVSHAGPSFGHICHKNDQKEDSPTA